LGPLGVRKGLLRDLPLQAEETRGFLAIWWLRSWGRGRTCRLGRGD
jgi:hypothetical protein